MSPDRSSAGDPARTLALLWRDPSATPRRGPRRAFDLEQVVVAAVALADERGLEAVTIRGVADRLGVAPMSVYTYVPGKAELLDLMLDAVYAAMARSEPASPALLDRLRAVAEDNRLLYAAHPWAAAVSTLRPSLGPGALAKYEYELAAFDGCAAPDVIVDASLTHLLSFVRTCARDAEDAARAVAESGHDDAAWWAEAGQELARYVDPARYPRATRIGTAAGEAQGSAHDPEHAYRFGLERVLEGLAPVLVEG
ncbi:TetR family transcriptional regulator [Actinotalea sp. BY-33]|uniref:TetR family transcriptional regulator n=1 Tax=Actinotalea soli TaxID=2819234 RepID=A0A939RTM2_9CELL|nr:TetR/AcrR family transcriptional regulator [Actinotalea soli]MBO1751434.1 TetR family transcriptional regulator [Actinotalea soli]